MSLIKKATNWENQTLFLVFKLLRIFYPSPVLAGYAAVTRYDDVQEVLSRPDVFGVTYAEKMGVITNGSNFFLGMNDTSQYERDVSNMRLVIRRNDMEDIVAPMVKCFSDDIISQSTGELDVIKDLAEIVPTRLVRDYIGISGPSERDMIDWTTYMFQYLFFPGNPDDVDQKASEYAAQARPHIDALIAERKNKNDGAADDVLARCLALQKSGTPGMSDEDIRNNLIGILIGAIPTTSKCVALVMDYILDRPDLLQKMQVAAQHDDMESVRSYVLEILRLNPFGPGVFRITNEDYTVAKGTWRAKTIKKGTEVLAATQSGMMDGRQLKKPGKFMPGRPEYHYMLFGYGMHQCFGYYMNLVQIPAIVASLLKCKNLRRADGDDGKMTYRGPFPAHLKVRFDKV